MPLRVLVVDDNRDGADAFGLLFETLGVEVRVAYSGADALVQAEDFRPHAGFFDVEMPGMSGLELARRMRERQAGEPLLLAAVTGLDADDAKEQTAAAGFDHHFTKPPVPAELVELLRGFQETHLDPRS